MVPGTTLECAMLVTLSVSATRLRLAIFVLAVFCLSAGRAVAAETPETFKFTKIDLELLEKVNQVDREFERRGLVFNDPDTVTYIEEIGKKMVPESPLENVTWRSRVLPDPAPTPLALPHPPIYLNTAPLPTLPTHPPP